MRALLRVLFAFCLCCWGSFGIADENVMGSVLLRRATCHAASHRECGRQVGEKMAAVIQRYVHKAAAMKPLKFWLSFPSGQKRLAQFIAAHEATFPELVQEVCLST
jgi:hypothetical protein